MYGGHIRHGLPVLGGAGAVFGGSDGNDSGDHINAGNGGIFGGHDDGGCCGHGGAGLGGHSGGGFGGAGGHGGPGAPGGHGLAHGMPAGPHGVLPLTGFDSVKLAFFALVLVVGGLLLIRMIMLISNDH